MEILAIGSLIGAKLAAAGAAVAATAAAHPILFGLGALTAAAGATTGILGGVSSAKAASSQAAQTQLQLEAERTQAAVEEEERQKRLRSVLASQNAIFASNSVDIASGTPSVLAADSYHEAARQSNQAALFSGVRQSILGFQEQDARSAGRIGLTRGILGGTASLLNFGMNTASLGSIPGGGSGIPRLREGVA